MTSIESRPPQSKRERNKAEKQRRIVAAARKLFEAQGFNETTTSQISDGAGIGAGTLYLYFESKEELLFEVFREDVGRAWDDAFDRLDRSQSLPDQLITAFGGVSDFHLRDPELARIYFKELTFVSVTAESPTETFMRKYYDRLTALLLEAQDNRRLRDDVPVAVLARNLYAIWSSLMRRALTNQIRADELHELLDASFSVALLGLSPTN